MRERTAMMYFTFCHIPTLPVFCAGKDLIYARGLGVFEDGACLEKIR